MRGPLALIEVADSGDGMIALHGELDVGSTPALREWLSRASDGGRRSLTVDFSRVDFMAVSALYVLADEQQRMAESRARLALVCAKPKLLQLFEVCRLGEALCVVAARDALPAEAWTAEDDARSGRLNAWLGRYAAASA